MENDKNREEILKEIISDYEKKKIHDKQAKKLIHLEYQKKERIHKFMIAAGKCLIILLAFRIVLILLGETKAFENPQYQAMGKRVILNKETEKCIGNLWQIRKAIDEYYAEYRDFPENMDVLYREGFLEKITCPISGKEYVFEKVKGKEIFKCPNPEEHNVTSIQCDVESAVPVIER